MRKPCHLPWSARLVPCRFSFHSGPTIAAAALAAIALLVASDAFADGNAPAPPLVAEPPAEVAAAIRPEGRGAHWVDEATPAKGIICYGESPIRDAGLTRSPSFGLLSACTMAHTLALGEAAEMVAGDIGGDTSTTLSQVEGEGGHSTTIVARSIAETSLLGARVVQCEAADDHVWIALWVSATPMVPITSDMDAATLARSYLHMTLANRVLVRSQALVARAPSGQVFFVAVGIGPEDPETTQVDTDGELSRRGGVADASRVARDNCDYSLAAAKSGTIVSLNAAYCERQQATRIRDAAGRLTRLIDRQRSYSYRLKESLQADGVRGPRDDVKIAEHHDPRQRLVVHVEVMPIRP